MNPKKTLWHAVAKYRFPQAEVIEGYGCLAVVVTCDGYTSILLYREREREAAERMRSTQDMARCNAHCCFDMGHKLVDLKAELLEEAGA